MAVRWMSMGISTLTGPVGADSASTAARVSTPSACCAERTRYADFDTDAQHAELVHRIMHRAQSAVGEFRRAYGR